LRDELVTAAGTATHPAELVRALLSFEQIFGAELPAHEEFVTEVTAVVTELQRMVA
jgi:hypothetical protein